MTVSNVKNAPSKRPPEDRIESTSHFHGEPECLIFPHVVAAFGKVGEVAPIPSIQKLLPLEWILNIVRDSSAPKQNFGEG